MNPVTLSKDQIEAMLRNVRHRRGRRKPGHPTGGGWSKMLAHRDHPIVRAARGMEGGDTPENRRKARGKLKAQRRAARAR